MIRAGAPTSDGGQLVVLGITPANLRQLKDGKPIYVECDDMGLARVRIVLVFGQTERAIIAEMRAAGAELPASVEQGLRDVERQQRDKGSQP